MAEQEIQKKAFRPTSGSAARESTSLPAGSAPVLFVARVLRQRQEPQVPATPHHHRGSLGAAAVSASDSTCGTPLESAIWAMLAAPPSPPDGSAVPCK